MNLHEEHAHIERQPVHRLATASELGTFKAGSIEIQETVEEVVVEKSVRVVEEVTIGTNHPTVRRRFETPCAAPMSTSRPNQALWFTAKRWRAIQTAAQKISDQFLLVMGVVVGYWPLYPSSGTMLWVHRPGLAPADYQNRQDAI